MNSEIQVPVSAELSDAGADILYSSDSQSSFDPINISSLRLRYIDVSKWKFTSQ